MPTVSQRREVVDPARVHAVARRTSDPRTNRPRLNRQLETEIDLPNGERKSAPSLGSAAHGTIGRLNWHVGVQPGPVLEQRTVVAVDVGEVMVERTLRLPERSAEALDRQRVGASVAQQLQAPFDPIGGV
jgi:hypothetical protein